MLLRRLCISLLFFCFLLLQKTAVAQQRTISGSFEALSFPQFAERIEALYPCRFYYADKALDTFSVSVAATNATLDDLLRKVFAESAFRHAIDRQNNVYITKSIALQTQLPADFFVRKGANDTSIGKALIADRELATRSPSNIGKATVIEIGDALDAGQKSKATVAGYIREKKTGEGIAGATVYLDSLGAAIITDQFGYYTLSLPPGRYVLRISGVGMKEAERNIWVRGDGKLNIELDDQIASLKSVTVFSSRNNILRTTQMGLEKLSIRTIKQIPAVMGEVDVLRVVLALPGVTSVGEASTGFNVRGGSAAQNLVLYNDATIYNPAHLFGFFAAFNPDMVKSVDLYKSSIPEKYGGRLSSVLNVTAREGNSKALAGNGGIGLLTSRLSLDGPLNKGKTTFMLGGRTTYSNWLLKQLRQSAYRNSKASFYDANLHLQHKIDEKNTLFFTGYISHDDFKLNNDTLYGYGNKNINLKWKRLFNNRFSAVFTAGVDQYGYNISSEENKVAGFKLKFDVVQKFGRADFNYVPSGKHAFNFGLQTMHYKIHPGKIDPKGGTSLLIADEVAAEQALETALYAGDQWTINPKLSLSVGLRYSLYQYLGPKEVYRYVPGLPRNSSTVQDSMLYGKGKTIRTWQGPEIRVSSRYALSNRTALKVSFNTLRQYLHMLSNTAAISPVDIWKLSDAHIRPQQGAQLSLGIYHNSRSGVIETSAEVYYKRMKHYLDYKSGAVLIMNHQVETEVFATKGRAWGAEALIKKSSGKLNGWIAYTYSRTFLQMDDAIAGEVINGGKEYNADFDKPHNLNLISNYRFSHRYSASFNLAYSTGRPITLPVGVFNLGGSRRLLYGDRNAHRIPDYFRMDLGFNIEGNHLIKKKTHNSWTVGAYNLLARKNVYSVYFVQEGGLIKGYQLSIFGTAIPYITYNFRF